MSDEFNKLISSFDKAIKKREKGEFSKDDVKEIYAVASSFFNGETYLNPDQINTIRDKWVDLSDGKIDKGKAMKKLQGTSRAEAIQSVLLSSI